MPALRAKSLALSQFLLDALRVDFAGSLAVVTPLDAAARGSQLSLRVSAGRERGLAAFAALGQAGVVADWREPDVIRVAAAPLYNQFADIARFLLALRPALA
jgi:kynureninase